jgi:starch-binding outer membrane protein, SusD/RagB family
MKHTFLNIFLGCATVTSLVLSSCTKLEPKFEEPGGPSGSQGVPTASSIGVVYNQLNQLVSQENWFAMSEHSTDELMGPTRGTDWDDFGTWRKLHLHTWDGSHNQVNNTWNGLNIALAQTTLLAESTTAPAADKAEAKFLRAFFSYIVIDLYGQLQTRPATAQVLDLPTVKTRSEATDYLIAELRAVIPQLPAFTRATRNKATKEAAQFLLAKALLNKAVYKADPNTPAGPYTFAAADMSEVVTLCDQIAANSDLTINTNYWDNFVWRNGDLSTESIFTRKNSDGINMVWATCMGNHYNMPPDGWNGFTTLADFYNSFENGDARKSTSISGFTTQTGRNAGFLIGQQQGPSSKRIGNALTNLKERSGNPLIFTPDVNLFYATESKGIRTNKYPLDPSTMNDGGWGSTNEFVFFRLADVRLMEAEAILRGGTATGETPIAIVNNLRSRRSANALGTVDLTVLLAERGREMYLEGVRRNDLIRYGRFNVPVDQRPVASAGTRVVFPIPISALASNPNLKQNVGY